jgi:hypothetical protein
MTRLGCTTWLSVLGILWLAAVGAGLRALWDYENAPGVAAEPADHWPANSPIARVPGRTTLVMLAHPHCPCTRASISELALLMAQCRGRLDAHVLFVKPAGLPEHWERTDLWRRAAAIRGVQVSCDPDGKEARRFHAATSGQVLLYDANGQLRFRGGITAARGHAGDNAGRSALVALVTSGTAPRAQTPVFGCSLLGTATP